MNEIDRLAAIVDEEKAREEEQITEATTRLNEARERADVLSNELAELNRNAAASRDARAAVEVQRAEALARVNFVRESCANELNQSLEELAREVTLDRRVRSGGASARTWTSYEIIWKTLAP